MYKFSKMLVRNINTTRKPLQPLSKLVRTQQNEKLLKPYLHVEKAVCDYHIDLYWAFNHWLRVAEDKAKAIKEFMCTFHNVIILFDDILDNSAVRYHVPAAHTIYSPALVINAACLAMLIGLEKLKNFEPKTQGLFLERAIEFFRGQGIDIYWRDNVTCPSEEEYIDMIQQKVSNIIYLSCQLHQLFSQDNNDYSNLAHLLGLYYQIRNDYCNLLDHQHEGNWAVCGDVTEGKFTLPIIHAVKHSGAANQVTNILKQRTEDHNLKKYLISLLEDVGSFQYTREKLLKLESDIYNEIQNFGGNPDLESTMDRLANWRECSKIS